MKMIAVVLATCLLAAGVPVFAQHNPDGPAMPSPQAEEHSAAELAKKLSNPIAAMISVPFQSNFDAGMGSSENGYRYTMNFQPVIPTTVNANWNLISRTIVPFIHQSEVIGTTSQTGVGDILQSLFFSPKRSKIIWGTGPVLLIPSATDTALGSGKFGMGPGLVVLKQKHGWTYGALTYQVWSVAGDDKRPDVNFYFLQPFLSYTTKTAWTMAVNTESSYDWMAEKWSVPIHVTLSKLVHFGKQPISFQVGPRCWATSPVGGPQGCVVRFSVTALFPKRPS